MEQQNLSIELQAMSSH